MQDIEKTQERPSPRVTLHIMLYRFSITGYLVSLISRILHLKDSNQVTDVIYIALLWIYLVSISYKACNLVLNL